MGNNEIDALHYLPAGDPSEIIAVCSPIGGGKHFAEGAVSPGDNSGTCCYFCPDIFQRVVKSVPAALMYLAAVEGIGDKVTAVEMRAAVKGQQFVVGAGIIALGGKFHGDTFGKYRSAAAVPAA